MQTLISKGCFEELMEHLSVHKLRLPQSVPQMIASARDHTKAIDPDTLLSNGDHYMHLKDLAPYVQVHDRLGNMCDNPAEWAREVILTRVQECSPATAPFTSMLLKSGR